MRRRKQFAAKVSTARLYLIYRCQQGGINLFSDFKEEIFEASHSVAVRP